MRILLFCSSVSPFDFPSLFASGEISPRGLSVKGHRFSLFRESPLESSEFPVWEVSILHHGTFPFSVDGLSVPVPIGFPFP